MTKAARNQNASAEQIGTANVDSGCTVLVKEYSSLMSNIKLSIWSRLMSITDRRADNGRIPCPPSFVWAAVGMADPNAVRHPDWLAIARLDREYEELRDMVRPVKFVQPKYREGHEAMSALLPHVTDRQWAILRGINDLLHASQTLTEQQIGDTVEENHVGYRASGDAKFGTYLRNTPWECLEPIDLTRLLGWAWTYRAQLETRRTKRGVIKSTGAILRGLVTPR